MIKLLIFLLGFSTITLAQEEIPFEDFEICSTKISSYQSSANGSFHNDNGSNYTLSFPDENFVIYFFNQSASNTVIKKYDKKTITEFTDNIDLAKVNYIELGNNEMHLTFPENFLNTEIYEDGEYIKTNLSDKLILYFDSKENGTIDELLNSNKFKLYHDLILMIHRLKYKKGTLNESFSPYALEQDWLKLLKKNQLNQFVIEKKNFENSLYEGFLNQMIQAEDLIKKGVQELNDWSLRFSQINKFDLDLNYERLQTIDEQINTKNYDLVYTDVYDLFKYWKEEKKLKKQPIGINEFYLDRNKRVVQMTCDIKIGENDFDNFANQIRAIIEKNIKNLKYSGYYEEYNQNSNFYGILFKIPKYNDHTKNDISYYIGYCALQDINKKTTLRAVFSKNYDLLKKYFSSFK